MGKTRQRPSGLVERTRTYDGKRVHFYGRRVAEVNAKIAAYEEEESVERARFLETARGGRPQARRPGRGSGPA